MSFLKKLLIAIIFIGGGMALYSYTTKKEESIPSVVEKEPVSPQQESTLTAPKEPLHQQDATTKHPQNAVSALARFGTPKYPDNFTYFKHVNPEAPKGGILRLGTVGTFDSVNKDIVKGIFAEGLLLTFDPLMSRAADEPFTVYGVLAESVQIAPDSSWIIFHLNPNARFHDDSPVTSEDVRFTIELLRDKGLPLYKQHYSRIVSMDLPDAHTIKMSFKPNDDGKYDPELPLIISVVRVLSKKQLENVEFSETGLTPIMGSGPYKITQVEQGRSITYQRNPNYWGKDLPVNRGHYNFDTIRIEYFKNAQAHFQAFTAGEFDVYFETNPNQWQTGYNFPAVKEGRVKRIEAAHRRPVAVRTIIMNMRKTIFNDIRLRKALSLAFDFDTLNKMVFFGSMKCPNSLFANTFLAHQGPAQGKEKKILEKYAPQIDPSFFNALIAQEFTPAKTKGNGDQRENLQKADSLLNEAGWMIKNGKRVNAQGQPLQLEFMLKDPKLEKIALSYKESLKKLGIDLSVRQMDAVQYENRVIEGDFDMIVHTWANSLSPGNEQLYFFSAKNADIKGSSNYIGVKDPVAEELAREVTLATDLETLTASVHALDRYVMHNYFQIPLAYDNMSRWAYWVESLAIPEVDPEVGTNVMHWGWAPLAQKA